MMPSSSRKLRGWVVAVVLASAPVAAREARAAATCDTDCNAMCRSKFPRWYQQWDRSRCATECFDTRPSCMPASVDLHAFDATAAAMRQRLVTRFLEGGYVVSRQADGSAEHKGDSVLWSSIAMAVLPCDQGRPIQDAITASVAAHGGGVVRFEPLPASYADNVTSRDMETGAIFGFSYRSLRCGGQDYQALRSAWSSHASYVDGGWLAPTTDLAQQTHYYVTPGLDFAIDAVSHLFGVRGAPSGTGKATFESALLASVTGVSLQGGACYPVHLSTLLAITAELVGRPIKRRVYDDFCSQSAGMQLPLTDWYCGRLDAASYLASYVPNQWEYRHQRCGSSETPDMSPGQESPGLDYLVMHGLAGR